MGYNCSQCGDYIGESIDQVYSDAWGMMGDLCKKCYNHHKRNYKEESDD